MHQPLTGIMPAQQRLDTFDATGRHVDLRLVVEQELVLVQGDTQLVLQGQCALRYRCASESGSGGIARRIPWLA